MVFHLADTTPAFASTKLKSEVELLEASARRSPPRRAKAGNNRNNILNIITYIPGEVSAR